MNPIRIENTAYMNHSVSKVRQLQEECESWKRKLELLMRENVELKTRLAAQLKENTNGSDFVEVAEQYQNYFMLQDEIIKLARTDVSDLDKLLLRDLFEDGILFREVVHKHKRLKKEVYKIEKGFNKLKQRFNNFISETQ
jgi:Zn-dependent M32 family carboxypeptidase